ncbi:MAG TPA: A/G-specific adenine glycosylase [Draconibacterium sp.]|nr:A/G-specific adenine glycosylase [Draconibacterium sp.]
MEGFTQEIYRWYINNKRDLPWRETSDPYKIWISEIILQQTRVVQGLSYYNRFIENFPTVFDLASASEDTVLKLWQGLGYYSRARNLHATAKLIVKNHKGVFPNDYKSILSLKGIGTYTAAAIASIAFNLPHAAVDGNIYRVISRYFGISTPIDSQKGKTEIQKIANDLIAIKNPGFHNQAFMEFGALQCIPKSPNCNLCPILETCYSAKKGLTDQIPFKEKKVKQRIRFFYYYIIENKNAILLEKRTGNDIWKNLHQFPLIESESELSENVIINMKIPVDNIENTNLKSISGSVKHVLTHQTIYARFIHIEAEDFHSNDSNFIRINKKDIYKFAVPRLLENYLDKLYWLT